MNSAHIHLMLNHVPVLGTIFGLALLGYAMVRRNEGLKRIALGTFVVVALLAFPVYFSGEPAEEVVERAAAVSKPAIEAHEEAALMARTANLGGQIRHVLIRTGADAVPGEPAEGDEGR